MNDLEFVDTKALIAELVSRFDIGAVVLLTELTEGEEDFIFANKGGTLTTIGLLEIAKSKLLHSHNQGVEQSERTILPDPNDDDNNDDFHSHDDNDELDIP